jgi:transcriptional regulator NrdR family protein
MAKKKEVIEKVEEIIEEVEKEIEVKEEKTVPSKTISTPNYQGKEYRIKMGLQEAD